MKKSICVLLSVVLLCIGAGCVPDMEKVEWTAAVDERIVESIGAPTAEALETLGLTEENKSEGCYTAEFVWCGMPMDTLFGFYDGVFSTVEAKGIFADDENAETVIRDSLTMLEEQFNAPYRFTAQDIEEGGMAVYEVPDMETILETLANADNGGVELRYSLSGENSGTGSDGPYVDAIFLKFKNEPGQIRVIFSVQRLF